MWRWLFLGGMGLWLAGCGGGVYLTIGDDDFEPPQVQLVAQSTQAQAGQTVRLAAAAADEGGIDAVVFYRIDGNTSVRLGSDVAEPYEWQFLVPSDGRTSVSVFARAFDFADNASDSATVTLAITP